MAESKLKMKLNLKDVFSGVKLALVVWIGQFILTEILASGGLSSRGYAFIIFQSIIIIVAILFLMRKKIEANAYVLAASFAIFYALFDYLVINLVLEKNSLAIYKFWPTYLPYALIICIILYVMRRK